MNLKCIIIDDEPHAVSELEDLVSLLPNLHMAGSFPDVIQAVSFLQLNGPVDIIFSDISMPVVSGIDSAGTLKKFCNYLVYVTAHRNYAVEAFEVSAAAYLIKPIGKNIFLEKVNDLIRQSQYLASKPQDKDENLFVKGSSKNSFIKINFNDIIYIEAMLNYVIIHTIKDSQVTYIGLKEMMNKLQSKEKFMRINKSIIVSTNHINHVDGNLVHLENKKYYAIGKSYKNAFHEYITKRTLNGV
jgi:two-component system LytT family response regulator